MTTLVKEVYDAFAGEAISKEKAEEMAVVIERHYVRKDGNDFATKSDIARIESLIQDVKVSLIYWLVGALTISVLVDKLI